jgi:5-methylcytosine-specific restriction protein A
MAERKRTSRATALIETEALIVAYAMSRFDRQFLSRFKYSSWKSAFEATGKSLGVAPTSMKNLRDEFDPVHDNSRQGWHKRPLRPNRQRVLGEFCDSTDESVFEIVQRLLRHDPEVEALVSRPLVDARSAADNVAERLRTGRLAEEFFLANSTHICGIEPPRLRDVRIEARGFDFGVKTNASIAIEVKGLKTRRGSILFTEWEWAQANQRKLDYWLVVVGAIGNEPIARLIKHPVRELQASSSLRHTTAISWRANVEV